jgi:hypothetical protein
MKPEFCWSTNLKCSDDLKLEIEENFRKYIRQSGIPQDCLKGEVKIFIEHTGPLNRTLNGQGVCQTGEIFEFSSSQDGRKSIRKK